MNYQDFLEIKKEYEERKFNLEKFKNAAISNMVACMHEFKKVDQNLNKIQLRSRGII